MLTTNIRKTMLTIGLIGGGALMLPSAAMAQQPAGAGPAAVTQGNFCRYINARGTKTCLYTMKVGTQCPSGTVEATRHWNVGKQIYPTGQGWECEGDMGPTHIWRPLDPKVECRALVQEMTPGNAPVTDAAIDRAEWKCTRKTPKPSGKVCRVMGGRSLQHCMTNTNLDHCSRGDIVDLANACQGDPWKKVEPANWWCNTEATKSGLTTGWTCLMR